MGLDASLSPHCKAAFSFMGFNAARQAPSSASAWPATTIDGCFPVNDDVLASLITHQRDGRRGENERQTHLCF